MLLHYPRRVFFCWPLLLYSRPVLLVSTSSVHVLAYAACSSSPQTVYVFEISDLANTCRNCVMPREWCPIFFNVLLVLDNLLVQLFPHTRWLTPR